MSKGIQPSPCISYNFITITLLQLAGVEFELKTERETIIKLNTDKRELNKKLVPTRRALTRLGLLT